METMRFGERRKKSYKLQIFLITLFLTLGLGITYFAICNEKEPVIIGKVETPGSSNIDESNALEQLEKPADNILDICEVSNKTLSDKSNKKIKADITVPVIVIKGETLTELNEEIYEKFSSTYSSFKDIMKDADNNFTYIVSFKRYDNIIDNKNVLSITIHERMLDDAANKTTIEKIHAYNIDLTNKKLLNQEDVAINILGSGYKDKIKSSLKDYCVEKKLMRADEYVYSYTGFEKYYIKNNNFHLLFNPDELGDKRFGILNIQI